LNTASPPITSEVTSKANFAKSCGVHKSRVSHWIAEGKISGEALVGEGRKQQIRVEVAKAQLRARIDIGQRFGNAIDTRLDAANSNPPLGAEGVGPSTSSAQRNDLEEKIKLERFLTYRLENEKRLEEKAERQGRYTLAVAAKQAMGRIAGSMLTRFESLLPGFATSIAVHFKIPQRDVLHLLRTDFRGFRAQMAATTAHDAEELPSLIEDNDEDPAA
jgi:hypothetical protein